MKRILSTLLAVVMLVMLISACQPPEDAPGAANPAPAAADPAPADTAPTDTAPADTAPTDTAPTQEAPAEENPYAELGLVDGRFTETRHITVEVFDRGLDDQKTKPEDNYYSNWIKEGVLRDLNIEIEWITVPRWGEENEIVNLLAAGDTPDVCVTYNYPAIQEYGEMGGILDMSPYIDGYKELFPNLWDLLGEYNLHFNKDPEDGHIWAIEAIIANNSRINTFVREDWLAALNIPEPKTLAEFEAMLAAFKDNAETLLGADADKMIPFSLGSDVGWRANTLMNSFVPDSITDREVFIYGFDDRQFMFPNYKEGVRVLNKWYNDGLIWPDFSIYGAGDATEDNNSKAGFVGSFIHNWDYPYRNGEDSINSNLKRNFGDAAGFIAIDPFTNDSGVPRKFVEGSVDRKVFFPATNDEPLASMLYVDWISKVENRKYLQIGDEGVTHTVHDDGSIEIISALGTEYIQNSPQNIDYTITINGLDLGDDSLNGKSLVLSYAGIESRYVEKAYVAAQNESRIFPHYNVGAIEAESGMANPLKEKRDALLNQAVNASVADFDSVFDSGYDDYMASGGQAIIDARTAAYEQYFGSN
ncbi:MAG: extracellular solute-binding protein [Clostridiales bacterium]|jgi:putative aldouronate transport system substrate-binding protein|nr:extracellular solute-binding protein [Clostridiales bacterium]